MVRRRRQVRECERDRERELERVSERDRECERVPHVTSRHVTSRSCHVTPRRIT